ncbi:restriction endonuclease subunit S [Brytella acorum]|uniref:restriction endonuclease subunit S n=1 Tax=Brytella acorum TaxID=2959299 RepID=UPI0029391E22|nr:restriction endonuclease subunit S [Brytella acorum]
MEGRCAGLGAGRCRFQTYNFSFLDRFTVTTWRKVTISDVADEVTVGHVGPMASEYVDKGIPFLRSLNIEPFNIKCDGVKFITPSFHKRLQKSSLRPGDVVIVRTGKPGTCAVIPDWLLEANCSDVVIVRCSERVRPRFLCYVVNSVAGHHISSHIVGAVQQHFNVGSARTLEFLLPSIEGQDAILAILGALDDKIDLNRRTNETLEAMARALFRDWFVDFGPTQAKMAGQTPYLAPEIWALFPDRLDDEGKPEGWKTAAFSEFVSILTGGTPKTSIADYWNGDIPWFSVVDTPADSDIYVFDTAKKITKDGLDNSAASILPEDTVIITARGTVGKLAMTHSPMTMNQSCYGLRGTNGIGQYLVYQSIKNSLSEIKNNTHGSVFDTITRQTFSSISANLPSQEIAQSYEKMAAPFFQKILENVSQTQHLAQLRDLLLPKLMSGAIRIQDAEKMVEEAL